MAHSGVADGPMGADEILALYDRHARGLLGFFARRTGDPHLALDLLSDTFLAAFEHRARCQGRTDSERAAWLFAIAANVLAGHFRRGARERRATERLASQLRALTAAELATIDRLAAGAEDERLTAALAELSDEQRRAVQGRVVEERSYAAMSRELGISEPAARARVSRGLRALRRAVAGETERRGDGRA